MLSAGRGVGRPPGAEQPRASSWRREAGRAGRSRVREAEWDHHEDAGQGVAGRSSPGHRGLELCLHLGSSPATPRWPPALQRRHRRSVSRRWVCGCLRGGREANPGCPSLPLSQKGGHGCPSSEGPSVAALGTCLSQGSPPPTPGAATLLPVLGCASGGGA